MSSFQPSRQIVQAVIRTIEDDPLDGAGFHQLHLAAEFRQSLLEDEAIIIANEIIGIPVESKEKFIEAYLFNDSTASILERRTFAQFQAIQFLDAKMLVWNSESNQLQVDSALVNIPQSYNDVEQILLTRCKGLSESQINEIRQYTQKHPGPWQFHNAVHDFTQGNNRLCAVNSEGKVVETIATAITLHEFMHIYHKAISKLHPEAQQTIAYYLSRPKSCLSFSRGRLQFRQNENDPSLVHISEPNKNGTFEYFLARPQSTEEFFASFPVERYEFKSNERHIYQELLSYIHNNEGPWNCKGVVKRFFLDELGGVQCEFNMAGQEFVPLKMPFGEFFAHFIDDNDALTPNAKRLLEKYLDEEKGPVPFRGNVSRIEGSEECGVFIYDKGGKISHAVFDVWEDPESFVRSDPLISNQSKELLATLIKENPAAPEWSSRGYIVNVTDQENGVVLTLFDGEERFIHYRPQ